MSRAANLAAQEIQEAIEHDARMLDDAEALASIIDRRFSNAAIVTITDMQAACDSAIASLNAEGKWTAGDVGNYTAAFFSGWHARSNFTPPERTRVEGEQWRQGMKDAAKEVCDACDNEERYGPARKIEGSTRWWHGDDNIPCEAGGIWHVLAERTTNAAAAPADNEAEGDR